MFSKQLSHTYPLLTECEVRTLSFGLSFFHCLIVKAHSAQAIKKVEKTRIHNLLYTVRANEVNKMFIIWQIRKRFGP
jgi:hypothetical protein